MFVTLPALGLLAVTFFMGATSSAETVSEANDEGAVTASRSPAEAADQLPSDLRPDWIGLPDLPEPEPTPSPETPPVAESPRKAPGAGLALAALRQESVALAAPAAVQQVALALPGAPNQLEAEVFGSRASTGSARRGIAGSGGWGTAGGFGSRGRGRGAGACNTPGPFGGRFGIGRVR